MPVACSSTALTGQEGSIYFSPAGTKWCLQDYTDFPSGANGVTVPSNHDFRVNDPVKFSVVGFGKTFKSFTKSEKLSAVNTSVISKGCCTP